MFWYIIISTIVVIGTYLATEKATKDRNLAFWMALFVAIVLFFGNALITAGH